MLISGHDLHTFAWCVDHICCPIIVIYRLGEGHCGLLFFVAKPHSFTEDAFFFELKRPFKDRVFDLFYNIHCGGHRNMKPGVIKALLVGLKDFLMNAGSSLAAALIQASIQGLF